MKVEETQMPDGGVFNIFIAFHNEEYLWLFENKASKKVECNILFKNLMNLQIVDNPKGVLNWKVIVTSQNTAVKKLRRVDAAREATYGYNFKVNYWGEGFGMIDDYLFF